MWAKMSKSKGNVVLPEEVIRGVYELEYNYEFRGLTGMLIDYKIQGVWFEDNVGFRTSTKYRRQPVFLHEVGNPIPVWLTNLKKLQHEEEIDYWSKLLCLYEKGERDA